MNKSYLILLYVVLFFIMSFVYPRLVLDERMKYGVMIFIVVILAIRYLTINLIFSEDNYTRIRFHLVFIILDILCIIGTSIYYHLLF